ncbi:MAG: 4Fe-4S dicluster domain-containing protein [Thermoplasmatota archaeon]
MTRVITSACIGTKDTSCVDVCPVDCIHPHSGSDGENAKQTLEQAEQLYINPDECIDCGACESACPVEAIYPDDEIPEGEEKYEQINADYFA